MVSLSLNDENTSNCNYKLTRVQMIGAVGHTVRRNKRCSYSYFNLKTTKSRSDGDLVGLPQLRALGDALDDAVDAAQRRVEALRRQVLLPLDAGAKTPA